MTPLKRAGERAFFVAEQFRRDERRRDRCAVHANECAAPAIGLFVDGAGDQFLAGAGLAENQDSRIGRRDASDVGEDAQQFLRRADNLFEHRRAIDFFTQRQVFVFRSLRRQFGFFDVGLRHVPAQDVSFFVVHRIEAADEPAI